MNVDDEPYVASEYVYDVDANVSFSPAEPMSSTLYQDISGDAPFADGNKHVNDTENDILSNRNISKGEYSYHAYGDIRNFWAGPSYWKLPRNRRTNLSDNQPNEPKTVKRCAKKRYEKPQFICEAVDESSDDGDFIKFGSRAAKRIRKVNYGAWDPKKLKLPSQSNIPSDLFDAYTFAPSIDLLRSRQPANATRHSNTDGNQNVIEDDFPVSI